MGVDDINDFFFFLPNKHPVIMIQFNHPCNMCLRHIGGRLPGKQSLDWVTSGRFATWTVETDTTPTPTHMYALSHTPAHTALLSGLCQARGHCRMSQSCRRSLRGWNDVFVLPGSRSDVQCCLVLKFLVPFCVAFWEGAGGLFVFCQTPVCLQLDHMGVSAPCVRVTQEAACLFVPPECECWLWPCAGLRRGAEVPGKGS